MQPGVSQNVQPLLAKLLGQVLAYPCAVAHSVAKFGHSRHSSKSAVVSVQPCSTIFVHIAVTGLCERTVTTGLKRIDNHELPEVA